MPSSGCLPDTGIEPASLMSPALAGGFSTTSTTWEALRGDEKLLEYTQRGTWNELVEPHACCSKHPCPPGQPVQDLKGAVTCGVWRGAFDVFDLSLTHSHLPLVS